MYTECPHCNTFFKVTPGQLKLAEGKVRCGSCNGVFNAISHLMDEVPPSALDRSDSKVTDTEDVDTVFSGDSDIELMENAEKAFSEIQMPGESELDTENDISDQVEDDISSLEGLAGTEIISETAGSQSVQENTLSDLSDLDGLSDLTEVKNDSSGIQADSLPGETVEASDIKEASSPTDIEISDIELSSVAVSDVDTSDESTASSQESPQARSNLSEINRDIDDALDGLFDEDDVMSENLASESSLVSADSVSDSSVILDDNLISETISAIPNIDDSNPLPDLNLQDSKPEKKAASSPGNELELDLSDEPESFLSRSEERRSEKPRDELSDFELGDSLLSSDALDVDESDWAPDSKGNSESDMYSGDSFILEELDDDSKLENGLGFSKFFWVILIFLLVIVLAGQFIYLKRETLVKYPAVVPILELECRLISLVMPCEVPVRREPGLVELIDRNIISHPKVDNALLITTTIKNNADFNQPYPKMLLTFSDINQEVVARRMFLPDEYLTKDIDASQGMEIGVPIKVVLEIVDPGEEAVNFQFDFQ